jgi:hypothetical protein
MLDDLRKQASFESDEEAPSEPSQPEPKLLETRRSFDQITHTSDKQRFVLAVMLLVMVCLLGVILLLVTGKVVLPFG